jgi:YVTN family beta-propeller protein
VQLCCGPLGVSVSGNVALVSEDQGAQLARLDLRIDTVLSPIATGGVPAYLAFNDAGTTAYVANFGNHNVGIIDVASNSQTDVIPVNGSPLPIAVTRSGGTAFVTTDVNRFYKIDVASKRVVDSLDLPATSHHLLNLNDTLVYIATRDGGSVLEVNQLTMTVHRTFVLGGRPQGMAVATNRTELYVANEVSNVLHIINLASGAVTDVPLSGGGEGISLGSDGKLYVGEVFAGLVQVVDPATRTVVRTVTVGGTPREVATDAARNRVLVANEAGWVDLIRN